MKLRLLPLLTIWALGLAPLQATAQAGPESHGILESALQEGTEYTTLMHGLQATHLQEILDKSGPFTVFAPSDAAFGRMRQDGLRELMKPENHDDLRTLLAYHIVAGELTASRILRALCRGEGAARFTTVQGEELLATLEGSDIILTDCSGNRARIVSADDNRNNLVIHEIDTVILPRPL